MKGFQLDDEEEFPRPVALQKSVGLVSLVQKWGLAKDDRQANYVLIGIIGACILIMFVVLFSGSDDSRPAVPSITGSPMSAP